MSSPHGITELSARRRQYTFGMALMVTVLLAGALAFSPTTPAKAWSENCADGWPGITMQVVSGDFGLPLWLGFENYALNGQPGVTAVCYGTGAPGDSKAAGGLTSVAVVPWSNGVSIGANNYSDGNAAVQANVSAYAWPTYYYSTGGTGGGQSLTFTMPVGICPGPCHPSIQLTDGQTGILVGTVSQVPPGSGGTSAAYRVDNLCVKVDGVTVLGNCDGPFLDNTGITTTGTNPTNAPPSTPGPCVVSVCAPSYNSIGTTGNQIATLYVPGLGSVPVYGVHTCLYQKDASTPCPY